MPVRTMALLPVVSLAAARSRACPGGRFLVPAGAALVAGAVRPGEPGACRAGGAS